MEVDNLEFSISEYVDGGLSTEDRDALERRLETDAGARALLEEYRKVDALVRSVSMSLPPVEWNALAATISAGVDRADQERAAHSLRMPAWVRSIAMPLAMAAAVLIVAGVGIEIFHAHRPTTPSPVNPIVDTSSNSVALVTDQSSGPVQEDVAIGPSAAVKDGSIVVQYSADAAPSQSHVAIASGVVPAHNVQPVSSYDME